MDYPNVSMSALVFGSARRYPDITAYEYFGFRWKYGALERKARECARAFANLGIGEGSRVVLSLPNCPQTVLALYALNLIGAVAVFTHPLSAPEEMAFYLRSSKASVLVTLYQFYADLRGVIEASGLERVILTAPLDALPPPVAVTMRMREDVPKKDGRILRWHDFMRLGNGEANGREPFGDAHTSAVVLYSGGTSGKTKGIVLTNLNFNSMALDTLSAGGDIKPADRMLAVMPMFHGFGLGVCVHTALVAGGTALLVPRFTVKSYAKLLAKSKPNFVAGVPTLFEALLRLPNTEKMDLSPLRGVFSGGDALPPELKRRTDEFLRTRGAKVEVREGYGLTECVTACCLTPESGAPEGSIGKPYAGTVIKIVAPGTVDELPTGATGEICIHGPSVMPCYDDDPEETAETLRVHADRRVWLHTGDLGMIDGDGFVYFRGRLKRIIVTSGHNVYPFHVESALCAHEYVARACVVGVADDYRMQRVKAFIVPAADAPDSEQLTALLREHCRHALAPQSRPREYEFVASLPMTKLGKVDYVRLENG